MYKMGWRRVASDSQGGKMLSTMTMEPAASVAECYMTNESSELFTRQVGTLLLPPPNSIIQETINSFYSIYRDQLSILV